MATFAIGRSAAPPVRRQAAPQAIAGVLTGLVAAALTAILVGNVALKAVAILILALGSIWFASTRRAQLALGLLMVYLGALDGVLKLSTGSSAVTFVRDALLYALVAGLLLRATVTRQALPLPPLGGWVLAFVVLVLIQLFNPQNGSLLHSLAGVRQNLEFVPLFFLTFAFVRTKAALRGAVVLLTALALANGVANIVQSRMSPQQLAAWGPGYAERVLGTNQFALGGRTFYDATGQQHTRPFGLMSDAGTGGLVDAFALGCVLALVTLGRRWRYLALGAVAGVTAVAGVFVSQGRSAVVCSIVVVLAYAGMASTSRRALATVGAVAALAGVAYFVTTDVFAGTASRYGGLGASQILQTTAQARGTAFGSIPSNLVHYPLGSGLGTGGPAAGQSGAPAAALNANTENEISYATLETGIPGMLVLIGFTGVLFVVALRRCRAEPDAETRILLAAVLAPVAGMLALYAVSPISATTPSGAYLWAAGGIVSYWLVTRHAAVRSAPLRADVEAARG